MKIVIVGGGTAGWLSALYLKKIGKEFDITLIESEEIGILGAGEGSVPIFHHFLETLGIDEKQFIKNTHATFKIGIHFENWKKDGSSYFHPFIPTDTFRSLNTKIYSRTGNSISVGLPDVDVDYAMLNWVANEKNLNNFLLANKLAYDNKSPFLQQKGELIAANQYSYHFDASLLANFLRNEAENKGVNRIEGKVEKFIDDENGFIRKIILNNGVECFSDFVIDCTGFSRKIIGEHYKTNWISYKDKLKVDSAIPFFLPQSGDKIKPYTEAIAMDYGWMWKIPLQHRYGCGYIFDSSYISFEEAKAEVEKFLGKEIKVNKEIKFNAGRHEKFWIKNCISIGLSSGFTEPIEATAIWTLIEQLVNITKLSLVENDPDFIDEYNTYMGKFNDSICDFLHFHYFTNKDNTPFWKNYMQSTNISKSNIDRLNMWKKRTPNIFDKRYGIQKFDTISHIIVGMGISDNLIPIDVFKKENELYQLNTAMKLWMDNYINNLDLAMKQSVDHKLLLKSINENADK